MTGEERRKKIIEILQNSEEPVSGTELAKRLNVSEAGHRPGYRAAQGGKPQHHFDDEGICTVLSGYKKSKTAAFWSGIRMIRSRTNSVPLSTTAERCWDVIVMHDIYGEISTGLIIKNRQDVYDFVEKLRGHRTDAFDGTDRRRPSPYGGGGLGGDPGFHRKKAEREKVSDRGQGIRIEDKG